MNDVTKITARKPGHEAGQGGVVSCQWLTIY